MWKLLFEFSDNLFAIVPVKKWRDWLRQILLFDYRRKLNALKSACPELNFKKMHLAKGGGSIVFIVDNKYSFKVRKRNNEVVNFKRFEHEKRITDAIRPYCTIEIPQIEFIISDGYTFYKNKFIPGKLLVNVSSHRIKKYQKQISHQLAEFIYKKSFANPPEIADLRAGDIRPGYSWNHGDMCSNILINPKTMVITGIIDWEWASYSEIIKEFKGLVWVRKKMRKIGLDKSTETEYTHILERLKK
jgi:hypothetical protein